MILPVPIRALLVAAVVFGQAAVGGGPGWELRNTEQPTTTATAEVRCDHSASESHTGWSDAGRALPPSWDAERKSPAHATSITKHRELLSLRRIRPATPMPLADPPIGREFRVDAPASKAMIARIPVSGIPTLVTLQVRLDR